MESVSVNVTIFYVLFPNHCWDDKFREIVMFQVYLTKIKAVSQEMVSMTLILAMSPVLS